MEAYFAENMLYNLICWFQIVPNSSQIVPTCSKSGPSCYNWFQMVSNMFQIVTHWLTFKRWMGNLLRQITQTFTCIDASLAGTHMFSSETHGSVVINAYTFTKHMCCSLLYNFAVWGFKQQQLNANKTTIFPH